MRPGRIQNILALASRVLEPNRRYEVLEKAISRIRIVLLLWETNKRLKRARFNLLTYLYFNLCGLTTIQDTKIISIKKHLQTDTLHTFLTYKISYEKEKLRKENSKQAIKNGRIFCSAMFVLIFDFGARACYSTTWYSRRHRFHFYPDPTVHTSTKDVRIRFYPLSRAFPNLYGFGGSDPRVSVDGKVYGFERIRVRVDGP